jgi:hypothetical protein
MEDLSIYISGPISNADKCTPEQIVNNIVAGEDIYGALIKKGWNPECPHMSYYPDKRWKEQNIYNFDHGDWLRLDKQKVWKNKYFFYMLPEKYGESKGAEMELAWAKQWGKKIFTSLDEVPTQLATVI